MKPSFSRRFRRRSPAHEAAHAKKENKKEQSFFGENFLEPFFKPVTLAANIAESVHRKCTDCEEKEKKVKRTPDKKEDDEKKIMKKEELKEDEKDKKDEKVQRKETSNSPQGKSSNYIGSMNGKGNPLPTDANAFFSSRMGYDFSEVKVHTGKEAANSAKELNAKAFTVKNNIVFNEGQFDIDSSDGKRLMAHDLTHVVQQSTDSGKVQAQLVSLLTPAQEATAIQFNRQNYDKLSIRIIQIVIGSKIDGAFGSASVRAVAAFQQANSITINGQIDEATINAMIPGEVVSDRCEQIVQLVVDFFNIPTSDTLSIHFDPMMPFSSIGTTDFEPGNLRVIRLGIGAFLSAQSLQTEINSQLAVPAPVLPPLTPRPALLNTRLEMDAIHFNTSKFSDSRSIRIVQSFVQATPDGIWGGDTVQRVAQFQKRHGLTVDGKVGQLTLSQISGELIAAANQNSSIRLIVDYFNFRDHSNLLDVFFDPDETDIASNDFRVNEPVRVRVGPTGINQPFEGLVHSIAHEFEHVRRLNQGIAAVATHEFLGESIEILNVGMPPEGLEFLAPGAPGFVAEFADDAGRCLFNWNRMPLADQQKFKAKFIAVRNVVKARIAAGSPAQQALHAPLLVGYNGVVLPK